MGAAGALELAGNLPAFDDGVCHATINLDRLDPECALGPGRQQPKPLGHVATILNNSFGMLGINSAVIIQKYQEDRRQETGDRRWEGVRKYEVPEYGRQRGIAGTHILANAPRTTA